MSAAPAAAPSPASDSTGRTTQTQQQPQQPEAPTATTAAAPSVTAAVVASSSSNAVVSIPPSPYLINILPLITGASSSLASSDPDPTAAYPSASLLVPPLSFALVCPGVYRSACPSSRNLAFLQGLALKSVVYLCKEEYPSATKELLEKEVGVEIKCFPLSGNTEPFQASDFSVLAESLLHAIDLRNQPVLVHCTKGKHRTGCFVGVLRRIAGQSLAATFEEYKQYTGQAQAITRDLDRLMIESFDLRVFKKQIERIPVEFRPDWIA